MKNIVISTDFSTSYTSTILYALKLMKGQKCTFWILNLPPQDPLGNLTPIDKARMECIYFEGLQRIQKLQKNLDHYFPEEDFYFRILSQKKLQEQSLHFSLMIASTTLIPDWRGKMLINLFRKNFFPLLLIPPDLKFKVPQKVLMSLEPNLEIKQTTLAPFIKFFGNYYFKLELHKIYSDGKNPALEARDEFELSQLFEAYHPKIRKIHTQQIEVLLKKNPEQKQIGLHIFPVVKKATSNCAISSAGLQNGLANSCIPVMLINGSAKHQPVHFTRSSRAKNKNAFPL